MANKNIAINNVKIKKNPTRDEFYTTAESAEKMFIGIDISQYAGKTIYCNCDGEESEIFKFICKNFDNWQLKKVIATKYIEDSNGIKVEFNGEQYIKTTLSGDGSYCSDECEEILEKCDIVATNPPFSKLGHFIPYIFEHNKDFIIIANLMWVWTKLIKKYAFARKINFCNRFSGGGTFKRPNGEIVNVICAGLTTLKSDINAKYENYTFEQLKQLGKDEYDDADGILNINYIKNIPCDYEGPMYVPLSIIGLPQFDDKFDILGLSDHPVFVNGKNKFTRVKIQKKSVSSIIKQFDEDVDKAFDDIVELSGHYVHKDSVDYLKQYLNEQ